MQYTPTIGLEIHIELNTKSKMFCACRNNSDEVNPNTNICPVCLAHPGVLPVVNQEAIRKVVKTALALNGQVAKETFFERKNYFYPDLPKGYQISQYQAPLARGGCLEIIYPTDSPEQVNSKFQITNIKSNPNDKCQTKKIRIERVHLEEDTGKLVHQPSGKHSLVDFNRAGVPLMELVSEPDITSAKEARVFIKDLQLILRYLDVSSANMEKGEMRAEVNISLSKDKKLGTKVEIKNLNSIRAVEKAIEFEIKRQAEILNRGEKVKQETRGWHDAKEITFSQRQKEQAHDYRYFPEPDLPPLKIEQKLIDEIKKEIPELPANKRQRFAQEYGLSEQDIELYISQRDLGEYFEKVVSELREWVSARLCHPEEVKQPKNPLKPTLRDNGQELQKLMKLASNYISTDLQALLKGGIFEEARFPITPENFAEFLSMIYTGEISSKIAKTLVPQMFETGEDPSQIIEEKGLKQISDLGEIAIIAKKVIIENQKAVKDYKAGKASALQFLVGQLMRETKGKANPQTAQEILKKLL